MTAFLGLVRSPSRLPSYTPTRTPSQGVGLLFAFTYQGQPYTFGGVTYEYRRQAT